MNQTSGDAAQTTVDREPSSSSESSDSVVLESIQKRQNYIFSKDLMSVFNLGGEKHANNNNNSSVDTPITPITSTSCTNRSSSLPPPPPPPSFSNKLTHHSNSTKTQFNNNELNNTEMDNLPSFSESASCCPNELSLGQVSGLNGLHQNGSLKQSVKINKKSREEDIKEEDGSMSAATLPPIIPSNYAEKMIINNNMNAMTSPNLIQRDVQGRVSHNRSDLGNEVASDATAVKTTNMTSNELVLIDFDQFDTGKFL